MSRYTCIDAFCGAGGLSLGLSKAGLNVIFGFDFDAKCIDTLQANPKHVRHRFLRSDVKDMLGGNLLKIAGLKKGELDLLAGGPPCQGFSIQRTIGGDDDERNILVNDYGDLVLELLPKFFLLENVVGIGGKRGRTILNAFLARMRKCGYVIHEKVLDAQDYGVPQRRRRMIVIGERTDGSSVFSWPKPHAGKVSVRNTIGHLPAPPEDGTEHPSLPGHRRDKLSAKNLARIRFLSEGQARTHLPDSLLAECHRISADVVGHRNVYGRMTWERVAPTITARFDSFTRGQFGHPVHDRTISLYEGSLLQTFPPDYRFCGNKVEVARQIGNAVPPLLARALGVAIVRALKTGGRK